jgi:hypothetical protein
VPTDPLVVVGIDDWAFRRTIATGQLSAIWSSDGL